MIRLRIKIDIKIDTFKFQNYDTFKSISEDVEKNIPFSFSYNDIEQNIKIDVKSPLYIDFSEGLNEELGFKQTNFHLSPGGFTPKLLSLGNLRTSLNIFRLYLFIVTLLTINLLVIPLHLY